MYAECEDAHNIGTVNHSSFLRQATQRAGCSRPLVQCCWGELGTARRSGQPYFSQAATNPMRSAKAMKSGCRRVFRIGSTSAHSDIRQNMLAGVMLCPSVLNTISP